MNVYRNIDEIKRDDKSVISVGTFDGVHRAHKQIIQKILDLSRSSNARSLIITFDPHPQEVLRNKSPEIKLLTTTDEKLYLFEKSGIENVLLIRFTLEFSKTTARDFYEKYIYLKIGISDLVIGYDHVFGRNREGDFHTLEKLGEEFRFIIHRVGEIDIDGSAVSSTKIRKALWSGDVERANSLLGYLYGFDCRVVEGDKRGKELGFPTINIVPLAENKIMPGDGVYCVKLSLNNNKYYGMMNIGYRPTLTSGKQRVMEINIFDFNKEIYGENMRVSILKKLRNEIKFGSKEELIGQLNIDKEQSLKFLNTIK
jgi:riboflavin kinase/FMN adenylyltransferase